VSEANQKLFDLNIEKVLEDWEVYHAVREIIANALDEQLLTKTKEIEIFKDGSGQWHIRDFGRGLRYQHLTQNENDEKLSHPNLVIGKFGVGLKDALATFERHKIGVVIRSRFGDLTIVKSEKHGFQDITTLHVSIAPPTDKEIKGTDFTLRGCTDSDIETAKSFFLKFSSETVLEETPYGSILKKTGRSHIYINGLEVAEEDNFLFSYNITSITQTMRKALSREKSHLGRTAYAERVKAILLASMRKEVAELLVQDIQQYESGLIHDELKWNDVAVHASKLLNAAEKVVFLTPSQLQEKRDIVDHAKNGGLKIVTIPENVGVRLSGTQDYQGNVLRDLEEFRDQWNRSFEFKFIDPKDLRNEERAIFDKTDQIVKLIGGLPWNIRKIMISETMRMETAGSAEATGLWEASEHRIIIKRTQLRTLENYAGTLIHEIAHAKSVSSDISRKFEDELTSLLGLISSKVLRNEIGDVPGSLRAEVTAREDLTARVKPENERSTEPEKSKTSGPPLSDISQLVKNLGSENKIVRYNSIKRLESEFYSFAARSSHDPDSSRAKLNMNRSSSELVECVEHLESGLKACTDETSRMFTLSSLLMAKRTFFGIHSRRIY
jgi:hypothetical protein